MIDDRLKFNGLPAADKAGKILLGIILLEFLLCILQGKVAKNQ
jgi:hypothetical protein